MGAVRLHRAAALAALAFLTLAVSACGGSETGATAEQVTAGAELLRADTLVYAAVDSDLDSDQWQTVDDLLRKFPGRADLLRELRESLAEEDVNYERDIEPALGPAFYVGVTEFSLEEEPGFVVLHQPEDAEKFEALLRKGEDPEDMPEFRKLDDGWYALGDDQESIDEALADAGAATLADNEQFQQAMEVGEEGALAKAFVNGESLMRVVREVGTEAGFSPETLGYESVEYGAASVSAEDEGIRFDAEGKGQPSAATRSAYQTFESKLVPQIPSGALAVVSFDGAAASAQVDEQLRAQPGAKEAVTQFERMLGVSLDDLLPLLENEVAFYVRPGSPLPELTLVLEAPDEEEARATVDRLMEKVGDLADGERAEGEVDGLRVTTVSLGGFAVHYATFDDRLMLTSARGAFADFRGDGEKLADDAAFNDTREAAGMPDENAGFVYLNLREGIPLALDYAELADEEIPDELTGNLRPLTAFLAYGAGDGETATATAYLKID